jgi:hypothetical protein
VLRTYQSLSKIREAEEVIRSELVRPFVQRTIRRDALLEARSPILPSTPSFSNHDRSLSFNGSTYHIEPLQSTDLGLEDLGIEGEALKDLYNKILAFIARDCGPILEAAERKLSRQTGSIASIAIEDAPLEGSSRQQFHVVGNVIWDEVSLRLASELGHVIFASGQPDTFHKVRAGQT